jgi:hypothetical protein
LIALAGLAAFTSGCAGLGHEGRVIEHHPGQEPRTLQAPYDATYELFAIPGPGLPPVLINQAHIPQTHHVGFIRGLDGTLLAYAVGQKFPLLEGHYRWRMLPEDERTNSHIIIDGIFDSARVGGKVLEGGGKVLTHVVGNSLADGEPRFGHKSDRSGPESTTESKPKSEERKTKERSETKPDTERKEGEIP